MPRAPVCPFFGRARKESLVCLMGGADTAGRDELQMYFPSQMGRLRYWVDYCCGDWKKCTLAAALWEEYERAARKPPQKKPPKKSAQKKSAPKPAPKPSGRQAAAGQAL